MNRNFLVAFRMEKFVMGIILSLIILVAAISIVSSLTMMVIEKTKEIGILKAMGATDRSVSRIFIIEGMVVALTGTLVGMALGFTLCEMIALFHIPMPGGGSVYILDRLPVKVEPLISYGAVPLVSLLICFQATLYPARQAAKLEPVDAIRFG
jgi:lipoprotein-releasing system permease protein